MKRLFSDAIHFARSRTVVAPALMTALLGVVLFACTEGRELTSAGGESNAVHLAVVPRYHFFGSASQLDAINLAHLTVIDAASHDTIAGPTSIALNPSDPQWQLPVDFNVPDDASDNSIVVIIELVNLTDGVEAVQWSGQTAPITVQPGATTPPPVPVDLTPGPADNLNVISILIAPVTGRTLEGDTLAMHAAVAGSGAPVLFWTSLDSTIVSVGNNGVVHTLLPGSARIVAKAGARADTTTITILQRPASVSVTPAPISFSSIGQVISPAGVVLDRRGAAIASDSVLYTVTNPSIASQTSRGSFQAVATGATTVTASAASTPEIHATVSVNVVPVATTITLSDASLEFRTVGEAHRVTGVAHDAGGTVVDGVVLQFRSENPAVATVAADGTITARGAGSTGVAVTTQSATSRVAVSVSQLVTAVSLSPSTTTLESIGATSTLVAAAHDGSGALVPAVVFTWSSSAPAIATVDVAGVVTARGNGTATITASAPGGASGTASVTVQQKVASIVPTPASVTLESIGATQQVSADARDASGHSVVTSTSLTWSSSAVTVATVDQAGVVTAVANGSATITVRSANGTNIDIPVTVHQHVQSLTLTSVRDILRSPGDTVRVTARALDANGTVVPDADVAWQSSSTSTATVDPTGLVRAVSSGAVTITATSGSATATRNMTVQLAIATVDVTPARADFSARGDSAAFTAVARDAAGNIIPGVTFRWVSGNPAVFTVDQFTGVVTAVGDGNADVVATAPNNVVGRAVVAVTRQLAGITLAPDSITIAHGSTLQFTATVHDAHGFPISGRVVTWTSSNTNVATVDASGLVTAVSDSGRAIITAKSGGAIASSTVITRSSVRTNGLSIVPGYSNLLVSNCIPFGSNTAYAFTGFVYRNIPAFHMNAGDRIAFDLGAMTNDDIRRNIFFSALNINPGPGGSGGDVVPQGVHATGWTQVVSDSHTPQNPRGNNVIGDYELIYTAETSYDFAGGGFAVGFQGSPPASYADGGCEQVLVGTTSSDPSGLFYSRFYDMPDLTLGILDNPAGSNASNIGGIRIYSDASGPLGGPSGVRLQVLAPPALRGPSAPRPAGPVAGGGQIDPLPASAKKGGSGGN